MLKNIHPLLNAELLHALASMGHGDEVAIVDRNYPASAHARRLVRLDGVTTAAAAHAILTVLPVDTFISPSVFRMSVVGEPDEMRPVHREFSAVVDAVEGRAVEVGGLDRFDFYDRCRTAEVVVATGEERPYGCFILVKGVIASSS